MNDEIRAKLGEEISNELSNLAVLASGSEEQRTAIENIVKLYKVGVDDENVDADYDEKYNRREMDNKRTEEEFGMRKQEFGLKKQEFDKQVQVFEHDVEKHKEEFGLREKEFELKKQEFDRQMRLMEFDMQRHKEELELRKQEFDFKQRELDRQMQMMNFDMKQRRKEAELREHELNLKEIELDRQERENLRKESSETIDRYIRLGVDVAQLILPLMFYGTWMKKGLRFEETGTFTSTTFRGLFNRFRPTK